MSESLPALDFLGVGVPRAGTTSLHHLLYPHPDVCLPRGKEILEVFRWPVTSHRWQALMRLYWPNSCALRGMWAPQIWAEPDLPERLARMWPHLKLVVVFRDPVERLWSLYRMRWFRGWESRSFSRFVQDGLDPRKLERVQNQSFLHHHGDVAPFAVWMGCYDRILTRWWAHFPRDRVLILVFEEMVHAPDRTVAKLFRFLGLSPEPVTLPRENAARPPRGSRWIARGILHLYRRIQPFWDRLPVRWYPSVQAAVFWASSRGMVRTTLPSPPPDSVWEALRTFYAPHQKALEAMLGRPLPWGQRRPHQSRSR